MKSGGKVCVVETSQDGETLPIAHFPGRSFNKYGDVYYYQLIEHENVTVNCGADVPESDDGL
jgi:hypothetical protein